MPKVAGPGQWQNKIHRSRVPRRTPVRIRLRGITARQDVTHFTDKTCPSALHLICLAFAMTGSHHGMQAPESAVTQLCVAFERMRGGRLW